MLLLAIPVLLHAALLITRAIMRRLFLTSYWLVLVCNMFGITLHYNYLVWMAGKAERKSRDRTGAMRWLELLARLFASGPWSDPDSSLWYNLQGAWFALLVPVSGLVYLTRDVLLNTNMPALALAMIWNLLLTYCMFGIVPSVVYITGLGIRTLPWMLDLLNVAAKFPLPIMILIGFIIRPVTFQPCTA
jgi:hypothetical protein